METSFQFLLTTHLHKVWTELIIWLQYLFSCVPVSKRALVIKPSQSASYKTAFIKTTQDSFLLPSFMVALQAGASSVFSSLFHEFTSAMSSRCTASTERVAGIFCIKWVDSGSVLEAPRVPSDNRTVSAVTCVLVCPCWTMCKYWSRLKSFRRMLRVRSYASGPCWFIATSLFLFVSGLSSFYVDWYSLFLVALVLIAWCLNYCTTSVVFRMRTILFELVHSMSLSLSFE